MFPSALHVSASYAVRTVKGLYGSQAHCCLGCFYPSFTCVRATFRSKSRSLITFNGADTFQDMQEIATVIRGVSGMKKVAADPEQKLLGCAGDSRPDCI